MSLHLYFLRSLSFISLFIFPYTIYSSSLEGEQKEQSISQPPLALSLISDQETLQMRTQKRAQIEQKRLQKEGQPDLEVVAFAIEPLQAFSNFEIIWFSSAKKKNHSYTPHFIVRIAKYLKKINGAHIFSFYCTAPICEIGKIILTKLLAHPKADFPITTDPKGCQGNPSIEDDLLDIYPFILEKTKGLPKNEKNALYKALGLCNEDMYLQKMHCFTYSILGKLEPFLAYFKEYDLSTLTLQEKQRLTLIACQHKGLKLLQLLYHKLPSQEKPLVFNARLHVDDPTKKNSTPIMMTLFCDQFNIFKFLYDCPEIDFTPKNYENKDVFDILFEKKYYPVAKKMIQDGKITITKERYKQLNAQRNAKNKTLLNFIKNHRKSSTSSPTPSIGHISEEPNDQKKLQYTVNSHYKTLKSMHKGKIHSFGVIFQPESENFDLRFYVKEDPKTSKINGHIMLGTLLSIFESKKEGFKIIATSHNQPICPMCYKVGSLLFPDCALSLSVAQNGCSGTPQTKDYILYLLEAITFYAKKFPPQQKENIWQALKLPTPKVGLFLLASMKNNLFLAQKLWEQEALAFTPLQASFTLIIAVLNNWLPIVKYLLEKKNANPNYQTVLIAQNNTPIMNAYQLQDKTIFYYLLKNNNLKPQLKNRLGEDLPLFCFKCKDQKMLTTLLKKKKFTLNKKYLKYLSKHQNDENKKLFLFLKSKTKG